MSIIIGSSTKNFIFSIQNLQKYLQISRTFNFLISFVFPFSKPKKFSSIIFLISSIEICQPLITLTLFYLIQSDLEIIEVKSIPLNVSTRKILDWIKDFLFTIFCSSQSLSKSSKFNSYLGVKNAAKMKYIFLFLNYLSFNYSFKNTVILESNVVLIYSLIIT